MTTFILSLILICIFLIITVIFLVKQNNKKTEKIKELETKSKRKYENEKAKSELKEKLQTGDNSTRFDTSIDILQELSNKRK